MSEVFKAPFEALGLMGGKKKRKPSDVPTLDLAAQQQQETDRIARRRGNTANIYAGALGAAPAVASKTLLGT